MQEKYMTGVKIKTQ